MKILKTKKLKIVTLAISALCIIGFVVSVVSEKKSSVDSEVIEDTIVVTSNEGLKEDTFAATTIEVAKEVEQKATNEDSTINTETKGQESSLGQTTKIEENKEVQEKVPSDAGVVAAPSSQTVTLRGYIMDEDCYVNYPDPSLESRGCLNMPECAASGYGIAVQENGKPRFYYFDGAISILKSGERVSNANGGQQLAWDFIDKKISDKNPAVTVIGALSGESRTNPDKSTADGIVYSVIKVISIELNK